jgi:hypothetical protein
VLAADIDLVPGVNILLWLLQPAIAVTIIRLCVHAWRRKHLIEPETRVWRAHKKTAITSMRVSTKGS